MAKIWIHAYKCDHCEHKWIAADKKPKQCAKCRVRNWDYKGIDQTLTNPTSPTPTIPELSPFHEPKSPPEAKPYRETSYDENPELGHGVKSAEQQRQDLALLRAKYAKK